MSNDLDRLRVVLVNARNPLNIGAAARAMSNFGVRRLRVVNPYAVAFREARSAVGAAKLLSDAEEYESVAEAVADCTLVVGTTAVGHRELHHPLRKLEAGARLIRKRLAADKDKDKVALLFGSERYGLSNQDLSHCNWLMTVPTRSEHTSMNLGQAVAVCVYEIIRRGQAPQTKEPKRPARATEIERLTVKLLDILQTSGYIKPREAETTEEKVRRLIRRMNLESRDAQLWLGMLRQIAWKIGTGESPGRD